MPESNSNSRPDAPGSAGGPEDPHKTPAMSGAPLDPRMVAHAHFARSLSERHCPEALGGDCTWFHRPWLYFRALGVVTSVGTQADFFRHSLRLLAGEEGMQRVLISGAADDSMTEIVLDAFLAEGRTAEVTVLDRCETPLALSRSLASERGVTITTIRENILSFESPKPFDLVLTNSFLPYFDRSERCLLFSRWASLLRVGGKLLTTNRLRPGARPGWIGFSPSEAAAFCARVEERAQAQRDSLGLDPDTLSEWAHDYTARLGGYVTRGSEEVIELLRGAGFASDVFETTGNLSIEPTRGEGGPSESAVATYVRLLASRI